jgi:hypothetical protein
MVLETLPDHNTIVAEATGDQCTSYQARINI